MTMTVNLKQSEGLPSYNRQYNIFYSWQSDIDDKYNFEQNKVIRQAIQLASSAVESEMGIEIYIDQATRDTAGAINIPDEIDKKIKQCDIFIADISIINYRSKSRPTPNPNVMYELGIATQSVGWNNVINALNEQFGGFDKLPFDIKTRRAIKLRMIKDGEKTKIDQKELINDLTIAIKICLKNEPKLRLKEITTALRDSKWEAFDIQNGQANRTSIKGVVSIRQFHNHIFSFEFESYENGEIFPDGHWNARFFINEATLTTAEVAFRSGVDFGFKTLMFPFDRKYEELYLIGVRPIYGDQLLVRKHN